MSEDILAKFTTVQEIEEEIALRDTFELFDVERRGGLDEELFGLLLQQVRATLLGSCGSYRMSYC